MEAASEDDDFDADGFDAKDLPEYDEEYAPVTRHKSSLTMYVRSLTNTSDAQFEDYSRKLADIIPNFNLEFKDHSRLQSDPVNCPSELTDPFQLASSLSYSQALSGQIPEEEEEMDDDELLKSLYSIEEDNNRPENYTVSEL